MWSRVALCLALLLASAPWTFAMHASAQQATQDDRELARALFESGLAHVDAGRWAEAEADFRKALALRDSPVIRFNLAITLNEQKRYVEAGALLRGVASDPGASPALRAKVPPLLEALAPLIARLTIHVEGVRAGSAVQLDGRTLSDAELDQAIELDPGHHEVRLLQDGAQLDVRDVALEEGMTQRIALELPPPAVPTPREVAAQALAAPEVAERAPTEDAHQAETRKRRRRWWGFGAGAVAVAAGVATGVALALRPRASTPAAVGDFDPPTIGVRVR